MVFLRSIILVQLPQRRALLYLHSAVKEISSKKVGLSRIKFQVLLSNALSGLLFHSSLRPSLVFDTLLQDAAPQIFQFISSLWNTSYAAAQSRQECLCRRTNPPRISIRSS